MVVVGAGLTTVPPATEAVRPVEQDRAVRVAELETLVPMVLETPGVAAETL